MLKFLAIILAFVEFSQTAHIFYFNEHSYESIEDDSHDYESNEEEIHFIQFPVKAEVSKKSQPEIIIEPMTVQPEIHMTTIEENIFDHFNSNQEPQITTEESLIPDVRVTGQTTTQLPREVELCIEECRTKTSNVYDPVCGTDERTYTNTERMLCANDCDAIVNLFKRGTCVPVQNVEIFY